MSLFGASGPKRRDSVIKALPPIPVTGWVAPQHPPNLQAAVAIGFDTETKDLELKTFGPGWGRGKSKIVGASIAAIDRQGNRASWYFPLRHEVEPQDNLNPAYVLPWLRDVLEDTTTHKIGANIIYDVGNLADEDIFVQGPLHDIQFAEALIDNNARVGLDILAQKYLGEHKATSGLEEWALAAYKGPPTEWRKNIYRCPPRLVGRYGEADADLPVRIIMEQWPELQAQDLMRVYDLETGLVPLLVQMRRAGVSVDVNYAAQLHEELTREIKALYERIRVEYGYTLGSTDSRQVGKLFDLVGITYPLTKAGNPSIEKEWLETIDHPAADLVHELREKEKIDGTFLQSYILNKASETGKLHPTFHPLKGESMGTKLGRFSSEIPNLQNIPSRTKLGKRVREAFIPDPGHIKWHKKDVSQIHYRILAHNAVDRGDGSAERLRQSYINDPDMDYHFQVYRDVAGGMNWSQEYLFNGNQFAPMDEQNEEIQDHRRIIKNINFSGLYGVGEGTVVRKYLVGQSLAQGKAFLKKYHEGAPYIQATMDAIAQEAEQNGFVTTLLGRRIRFNLWEPIGYIEGGRPNALPYAQALRQWGSFIRLAGLYRAVNYKFQGTEPDIVKSGMLMAYKSGVYQVTGVPRVTVHDELGFSKISDSPEQLEAYAYIRHCMETALTMRVPIKVDSTEGPNWGKAK